MTVLTWFCLLLMCCVQDRERAFYWEFYDLTLSGTGSEENLKP